MGRRRTAYSRPCFQRDDQKMNFFLWKKATEEIVRSRNHMDSWRLTKAPRHITVKQEHSYLCWLLIDGCHWQRWMVGGGGRGEANSAYACNTLHSLRIKHVTVFKVTIYKILGPQFLIRKINILFSAFLMLDHSYLTFFLNCHIIPQGNINYRTQQSGNQKYQKVILHPN